MSGFHQFEILNQSGVIKATGPDAASFLHGQLTQNVQNLTPGVTRLAAYCNAKGRILATVMMTCHSKDEIFLITHHTLVVPLIKRLSLFILRAQCKLSDVSANIRVISSLSDFEKNQIVESEMHNENRGKHQGEYSSKSVAQPNSKWPVFHAYQTHTPWPDDQRAGKQYLSLVTVEHLTAWRDVYETAGFIEHAHTEYNDIQAGIAHICLETFEKFTPQMINFDLVGGVNFQKGCYPGQEIVARAHYLGKQKRRMLLGYIRNLSLPIKPGMDIYLSDQTHEPAGTVVNTCVVEQDEPSKPFSPSDHINHLPATTMNYLLFEISLERLNEQVTITLASPQGPAIHVLTLPYTVAQKTA